MSYSRQHLHELIDRLAPEQIDVLSGVAAALMLRGEDPNGLSDAERKAVAEADEWLKHNKAIPHEEILAEFGLTMADWEKMGREPIQEETPPGSA